MRLCRRNTLAAALVLGCTSAAAQPDRPRIVLINDPAWASGDTGVVRTISPEGAFVGGIYFGLMPLRPIHGFRWSEARGVEYLGALGPADSYSDPGAMSSEAAVIVGTTRATCPATAFMWREKKIWELPRPPDAGCLAFADDITPDGRTVVGTTTMDASFGSGVIWRDGKVSRLVSDHPDISVAVPWDITPDGRTIVGLGRAESGTRTEAVLYRKGRVTRIGVLPAAPDSGATGVSDDGRVVVGASFSQGFLWTATTGMVNLSGFAPSGTSDFNTGAISGCGRIVGGIVRIEGRQQAAIWTAHTGTRLLMTILAEAGVDLQGYTHILNADYMSSDGLKYACRAWRQPEQLTRPFYAVIPPFCFADCDNSGDLDFNDLLCFLNRFERAQDPRANPIDFFYCDFAADDAIDFNDFLAFLNLYNQGCPK